PPPNTNGNYYVEALVPPQSGSLYFKEWGACDNGTNNAGGIYQDISSAPGSTYQASGWFYTDSHDAGGLGADCYVWIEVLFLGSNSNLLALYKSDSFSASVGIGVHLGNAFTALVIDGEQFGFFGFDLSVDLHDQCWFKNRVGLALGWHPGSDGFFHQLAFEEVSVNVL